MSNEEIVTTATLIYDVRGADKGIRQTQRLLFSLNAIRLSMEDFKRLQEDPSFSNFLWMGIQLTRVWTNLFRLIKKTSLAQQLGIGTGAARAVGASTGVGLAGGAGVGAAGGGVGAFVGVLGATLGALLFSNPVTAALTLTALTISATGYRQYFVDRKSRLDREEFLRTQREIAKSQGYDF